MNIVTISLILAFVTANCTQALRCRSGNQKMSDEHQKVIQICKRRSGNSRNDDKSTGDDSSGSDDDSSSSEGSVFRHDFLSGAKKNESSSRRIPEQSNRYSKNSDIQNQYGNLKNSSPTTNMRNRNYNYGLQYENNSRNSNEGYQQFCRSHCFFDELNLVDTQGYPERVSVTRAFTQGIQDPELRDFIEESIIQCFHFIMSTMSVDKCAFSHHLLSCLSDKGQEGCDDWRD